MTTELIEKFEIEREVAESMAGIYNAYIDSGYVTEEDCDYALLNSMRMLDFNKLDDRVNSDANNDAYYLARGIVRLPFDSPYQDFKGNYLEQDLKDKFATAEFVR